MPRRRAIPMAGGVVHLAFTDVHDGDLCVDLPAEELSPRRHAVAPGAWTWLRQVHGARVLRVAEPGEGAGEQADASVTDAPGAVLAVHTADCAGVLVWGESPAGPVLGAAHAGWRGLHAGVLEATVEQLGSLGAGEVRYELGPCICPGEYEFGETDLDELVARRGPQLRARTSEGRLALDLRAGVRAALAAAGAVEDAAAPPECTAESAQHWSWRARGDAQRQAAVIWFEAASR
jgi:YfiH family protein